MRPWIVVLVSCCVGFVYAGQEFKITGIARDGTMAWAHPYSSGVFQVEWAASPAGPWFTSWEHLIDLEPDTVQFLSVPVPVCYRVAWLPDGTGSATDGCGFTGGPSPLGDPGDVEVIPIRSLGKLSWVADSNSTYRVEWAQSLGGPWFTGWDSLLGIPPVAPETAATLPVPYYYRVMCAGPCSPSMAYIPAGAFQMGDSFADWDSDELPIHWVYVSAFLMDRTEVTKAEWEAVFGWATVNGYSFDNVGSGKAADHPISMVNWYDCVKWCNARSEKEGLTPCYYSDSPKTNVYRSGRVDVQNDWVRWEAAGYRLPTEAEWEHAARGRASGHRFPWTDSDAISHSRANYYCFWYCDEWGHCEHDAPYCVSPTHGFHPDYDADPPPYTSPVGSFAPNGYGLHNVAGNVTEWCWDWHGSDYYDGSPPADPRGPASGQERVIRGGNYSDGPYACRVAGRGDYSPDSDYYGLIGFRVVKAAP